MLEMPLTLAQSTALSKLADHVADFLPGKPHPFADQGISFAGVAASLGLAKFWRNGSKLPSICQLLSLTLDQRPATFCALLIQVVQRGIVYRLNKGQPITREHIEELNKLISSVGYKIPDLYDPKFLDSLPRRKDPSGESAEVIGAELETLKQGLVGLASLAPQERGYRFEKFLADLFEAFKLAPRGAFQLIGEQIDGSFELEAETYLVEARWQNEQMGQEALLVFSGKVSGKAKWSRGLFLSYSGFTHDGLEAFSKGKPTNIICMDGLDLYLALNGKLDLLDILTRKVRRAAETNLAFVSVRELFPNTS